MNAILLRPDRTLVNAKPRVRFFEMEIQGDFEVDVDALHITIKVARQRQY